MEVMETALALSEPKDALAINRAPDLVLSEAKKAADAISQVIEGKARKVVFNGKTYLQFEDWQTVGRFYGVTAVCRDARYVEYGEGDEKVRGFEAKADALLVGTNQVISSAEAMCLNDEPTWSRKPLFQLKSMAQTRAAAKALRNVLAWVVVLAGYSGTPAEEMTGEEENHGIKQPQRKSVVTATPANGSVPPAPTPEVLNAVFNESSPEVNGPFWDQKDKEPVGCQHKRIQPAGISKHGKPFSAFCRDCKARV